MLAKVLEDTEVTNTTSISSGDLVALLDNPSPSTGLTIYANNSEVSIVLLRWTSLTVIPDWYTVSQRQRLTHLAFPYHQFC